MRSKAFGLPLVIVALLAAVSLLAGAVLENRYEVTEFLRAKSEVVAASAPAVKKKKRGKGQPAPYAGKLPSLAAVNVRDAVLEKVAGGLKYPWAMEFLPGDKVLVTEFAGTIKIVNLATKTAQPVEGLPQIPSGRGQIGLMDVALHPNFASNQWIYFSHAVRDPENDDNQERFATALSRARLVDSKLQQVERLLVATPYGTSPSNFGGALAFDRHGFLYLALGDRSKRDQAQNPKSLLGKILRLDENAQVPPDNPFVGDKRVDDRVYALGFRNAQGLVFDPLTGILYETEHGPMGGDEVNIVRRGANYGWPRITYGANYTTQKIGVGTWEAGLEQPLYYYLPSLAISPLEIYRGEMFREWDGDLLVGALKGALISKLDVRDGVVLSEQRILTDINNRIRDIKVAPDGSIYLLAQNSGRIYRLFRDSSRKGTETPKLRGGKATYRMICASCHSAEIPGIPQLSDPQSWENRLSQSKEILYQNTINGFKGMPPRGLCESCLDQEIQAAVDFMVKTLNQPAE